MSQLSSLVDTALDRTVVGGYTKIGYCLRRRVGRPTTHAPVR